MEREEEIRKAALKSLHSKSSGFGYIEGFQNGADWQWEQLETERLAHCEELTPEQAQMESDFIVNHLKEHKRTPTFIDAIEYGVKMAIEMTGG